MKRTINPEEIIEDVVEIEPTIEEEIQSGIVAEIPTPEETKILADKVVETVLKNIDEGTLDTIMQNIPTRCSCEQKIRDYFTTAYAKIEAQGSNPSYMSKQQFEAMLEGAFNTL